MTAIRLELNERLIDVALRRQHADAVLLGGRVVVVHTGEVIDADIAVVGRQIAIVGSIEGLVGPDTEVHDVDGQFVMPGFIDGHLHPENSRLSIRAFADVLVAAGTTSIVTGFDHLAAVGGLDAVRSALDDAAETDLQVFWAAPFRLPYTMPESTISVRWTPAEHQVAQSWPECIGTWELCPDWLTRGDPNTLAALRMATENRLGIFGSVPAAGESLDLVAAHVGAGMRIDHEAYDGPELLAKLRLGMSALIRDSRVEPFLHKLIGVLIERPELSHLVGFCTDGFDVRDVLEEGHISRLARDAVQLGLDPVTAVQMATINTARAYGIDGMVGSLTPGARADIVVCPDLTSFRPSRVFSAGRLVAEDGQKLNPWAPAEPVTVDPFGRHPVQPAQLRISTDLAGTIRARAIELTENAFHRTLGDVSVTTEEGSVIPDPTRDVALLAYVNRTGAISDPGMALVSGFGLRGGAMATSSTPDDENILCVGTNPADMAIAINHLISAGGADVVVEGGEVRAALALPIAGLMSDLAPTDVAKAQDVVEAAARDLGCRVVEPFRFLGLLAITGLPEVGMSEQGLIDGVTREVLSTVRSIA
jgi:adenine deaminase